MRHIVVCSGGIIFCLLLLVNVFAAVPCRAASVVLVSPTIDTEHVFWKEFNQFAEAAARNLGLDLEVVRSRDRYHMVEVARSVLRRSRPPDYLVFLHHTGLGVEIMTEAEKAGVDFVVVNTDIAAEDRDVTGFPGGKFKHWLYHLFHSEREAGAQLARKLIAEARSVVPEGAPIRVVGISGGNDTNVSNDRIKGLYDVVNQTDDVRLVRVVPAYWEAERAYLTTRRLLVADGMVDVIWSAGDCMVPGVLRALRKRDDGGSGRVAVGGIDASARILEYVEDGTVVCSVGGHFLEGAFAMVLIHDHSKGCFQEWGERTIRTPMFLFDRNRSALLRNARQCRKAGKLDFRRYSKNLCGDNACTFGMAAMLEQLRTDHASMQESATGAGQ